ncbi:MULTISPECIES: hypothetical protein [Moorena]|uniref:hypothetical protein n=1 Tax=Moorena TaxID=1155738 RepID=UPI0011801C21|nr:MULTISPECIES: hypothetical protein [Moorena]NEO17355.1 hypothetical protein [Moorena sp. SIO3E8]NEO42948.1 hypothetical protein [Moorena sp. SIO4A3]NEQ04238.1 hypothetical protein [Moorena sp. SIO3F7]
MYLPSENQSGYLRWVDPEWKERYGKVIDDYRLPKKQLISTADGEPIGRDGMKLLECLWLEETPEHLRRLPKVEQLRQYWVYQYDEDPRTDQTPPTKGNAIPWRGFEFPL